MTESIIVALITGGLSFLGVIMANRKSSALVAYRLDKIEEKLDKHNHFDTRIVELEKQDAIQNERLKVLEEAKS